MNNISFILYVIYNHYHLRKRKIAKITIDFMIESIWNEMFFAFSHLKYVCSKTRTKYDKFFFILIRLCPSFDFLCFVRLVWFVCFASAALANISNKFLWKKYDWKHQARYIFVHKWIWLVCVWSKKKQWKKEIEWKKV